MKNKKAISLVVLVITIIVMIIIASATIMSLSNTNVLDRAEKAVDVTNEITLKEVVSLKWMEGYTKGLRGSKLREYVVDYAEENMPNAKDYVIVVKDTGTNIIKRGDAWVYAKDENGKYTMVKRGDEVLEIGDYIYYTATGTEYTGNWMVFGAGEDGSLLIASENVTGTCVLGGIEGVEKGITILDNECSIYGAGYGAIKARNIRMKEINKLTGYNPNNVGVYDPDWEGTGTVADNYGIELSYYWTGDTSKVEFIKGDSTSTISTKNGKFYYYDEKKVQSVSMPEDASTTNKKLIYKQKYNAYKYNLRDQGIEEGTKIYNAIVPAGEKPANRLYWIAEINLYSKTYSMRNVTYQGSSYASLMGLGMGQETTQRTHNIRPLVELSHDIELTGSSTEGWTIIQN